MDGLRDLTAQEQKIADELEKLATEREKDDPEFAKAVRAVIKDYKDLIHGIDKTEKNPFRWKYRVLIGICLFCFTTGIIAYRYEIEILYFKMRLRFASGKDKCPFLSILGNEIKRGVTPNQIEHILGRPTNVDTTKVWLWVCDDRDVIGKGWRDLIGKPGFFICLNHGVVAGTFLKTAEANPWQGYDNLSKTEVETLLGKEESTIGSESKPNVQQ